MQILGGDVSGVVEECDPQSEVSHSLQHPLCSSQRPVAHEQDMSAFDDEEDTKDTDIFFEAPVSE